MSYICEEGLKDNVKKEGSPQLKLHVLQKIGLKCEQCFCCGLASPKPNFRVNILIWTWQISVLSI